MFRFVLFLCIPLVLLAKEVNIGVVAISGIETSIKEWTPTIEYLKNTLPEHKFKLISIEPNEINTLKKLIKEEKIDFIITQPAIYVELQLDLGVSRILTMVKENGIAEFGSVFIVHEDSSIETIEDIEGKKLSAVAPLGFGGWLVGYNELIERGIDPMSNSLVSFEGTQINVINSIVDGKSEVGVIRTGMLEKLKEKDFEGLDRLRVINMQNIKGFPFSLSTKLYPEWALAKTRHVSNDLSKEVATAFLTISKDTEAVDKAFYHSWTFPYSYEPVHELMKRLRVGPYKEYGKMSLQEIVYEYKYFFTLLLFSFLLLVSFLFYSKYMNKKLRENEALKNMALANLETIFDIQASLLFVIKDKHLVKVNTAFLNFFGFISISEFLESEKNIEEYFEYVEDSSYISFEQYANKWMDPLIDDLHDNHKVKILGKFFLINSRKLPLESASYIVMLNDISYMEDNKAYLETQIEIAKEDIVKKERELYKQSKQAAMGEMISMIAHQLKQPLSVISILLNRVILNIELDQFSKENVVENIGVATHHISLMSSTIDDFRDFFKPNKQHKSFLLEHCIHSVVNLLTPILQESNISVIYETDISIELVSLENELFHVVMNIINNAKDVLVAKQVTAPMIYINVIKNSDNLVLTIEDNAGGIDEAIIDKVFDQYFTTKENSGTGLGLHMSKMIVEESLGGRLSVVNGKYGAQFSITL